jgi:hypothetical protein
MLFNEYNEAFNKKIKSKEDKVNKIIDKYIEMCEDCPNKNIINDAKAAFKTALIDMITINDCEWIVQAVLNVKKFRGNNREDMILLEKFMRNFAWELGNGELQGKMKGDPEEQDSIIE